jgi:hypothetical protein
MLKTGIFSRDMYFAFAAEARRRGLPFGGHLETVSGARIIDHVNFAGGLDQLCLGPEASVALCRPVAERWRQNGTWWVPTLSVRLLFTYQNSPLNPGAAARAVSARLAKISGQFWTDSAPQGNWLRDVVRPGSTDSLRFLSIMQRVGLPILAGTDAMEKNDRGIRKMLPGYSLQAELGIYVAEGLTPLDALQTATLNPAKMLRGTDSLGTVTAGKLADLVLLDANPLADITNITMIRAVVANGRYYDRAALDQLVDEGRAEVGRKP